MDILNPWFVYRVTVASMNDQKQATYRASSGKKQVIDIHPIYVSYYNIVLFMFQATLGKNESVTMLDLDPTLAVFPLLLSFNFCVTTPLALPENNLGQPALAQEEQV